MTTRVIKSEADRKLCEKTGVSALDEARIVRRRKNRVHGHISEAQHQIAQISWIHPNGQPVYLDYEDRRSLEGIRTAVDEILERHKEAEEAL